jgi:glycosyltransferase involved in cell wall biosynthesis
MEKVLHIIENLNRGAVENWLVRMLAYANSTSLASNWTFYCSLGQPGSLDERVRELGAAVVYSPFPLARKGRFLKALRQELHNGKYDVVHCHHDLMSAAYLVSAAGIPIKKKIVHVHNADEALPTPSALKRHLLREPMRQICLQMADRVVGISNHTLDTFLAGRPRRPGRDRVHYYGVDPTPFMNAGCDRLKFRRDCDLPDDALILLFAGRIVPEKNPVFVIDVLSELRLLAPNTFALFAGAGSLVESVIARAKALNVENAIRIVGWRNDMPEVMSCCDWFILPHPQYPPEGFGLTVVEAQLAGLRLLLSDGISDDPLLPTANFQRLSLNDPPNLWADAAMQLLRKSAFSRADAIDSLRNSVMNMDAALKDLLELYT